jgi:hypothetical protein
LKNITRSFMLSRDTMDFLYLLLVEDTKKPKWESIINHAYIKQKDFE